MEELRPTRASSSPLRPRWRSFGWRSFGRARDLVAQPGSRRRAPPLLNPGSTRHRRCRTTALPGGAARAAPARWPSASSSSGHLGRRPPPGIWEGTIDVLHARDGVVDGDEGESVLLVHVTGGGSGTSSIAMARESVCHSAVEILAAAHQLFDVMPQRGKATRTRKR